MTYIIGISGWSGSGKTTLIEKLIRFFVHDHSLKVCTIKHAHSSFKIDQKGKDSYKFYEAGASKVIISSSKQWATINKVEEEEASLEELLMLVKKNIDIVIVEGWKFNKINKIEVFRKKIKKPLLCNDYDSFIAVATTSKNLKIKKNIPILDLNDIKGVGNFILNYKN
ncbi:MAG: Molybdopterin-guanine dinucleotide biosynthesis adapter protein [Alphaproteobacteria bacterium MarineAlpha9_Bin4]|nr:MAG: Molybdopterin-guanine dinucleotide biosynthesis adapter protein [Alphaproteobacteria bacterium MarineAlpha9_Bin4]